MKHFDPRKANLLPDVRPNVFRVFLRLWLSEASLRALAGAWGRFLRKT
jgi:hypothetical protein